MPARVAPAMATTVIASEIHHANPPSYLMEQPVKKQSKWSPEEDALIIELRGGGMKWEDISKRLPGRSAISCRLHYQNYLERRSEWDEERKNKLARLYERFKSEMWAKVAEELAIPWRAAEAMHWQLGEAEMARRAGVIPFSLAAVNMEGTRKSPSRTQSISHPPSTKMRERQIRSPRSKPTEPIPQTATPGTRPVALRKDSLPPPIPHPVQHSHLPPQLQLQHHHQIQPQQPQNPPQMAYGTQHMPLPPPPPPPHRPPPGPPVSGPEYAESYRAAAQGPGLPPLQMQSQTMSPGLLPSVAELTTGVSPYAAPMGVPSPGPGPWLKQPPQQGTYFPTSPNTRAKRKSSQDIDLRETSHRRRR